MVIELDRLGGQGEGWKERFTPLSTPPQEAALGSGQVFLGWIEDEKKKKSRGSKFNAPKHHGTKKKDLRRSYLVLFYAK